MRSPEAGGMREREAPEKKAADFRVDAAEWAAKEYQKLSAYDPHPSVALLDALKFVMKDQRREAAEARNKAKSERERARQAREQGRPGEAAGRETQAVTLEEQVALHEARVDALAAMMTEAEADVDAMLGQKPDRDVTDEKAPDAGASQVSER